MSQIAFDKTRYEMPIQVDDDRGIKVVLYIPPIFIPKHISGRYMNNEDCFEIKFIYDDAENPMVLFEDANIRFEAGKNTKKMLIIIVKNVEAKKINRITLEQKIQKDLINGFNNAISRVKKQVEKTNYEITRSIISDSTSNIVNTFSNP